MDFELNADDRALVEATRSFCEGRFPMKAVRELAGEGGVRRDLWRELASTGIFALRLPATDGGTGLGMAEAVLVFEELGRSLVPGPLIGTHLAAGIVAGAAAGDAVVGLVDRARRPTIVEHLRSLDSLLVYDAAGICEVDPSGIEATDLDDPFDPLTPVSYVARLPAGHRVLYLSDTDRSSSFDARVSTLQAAYGLGIARRSVELAVAYAGERHQFGRPVGSFQAVKHMLADAASRSEVARAAVHAAGVVFDELDGGGRTLAEARWAAWSAKLLACEAAVSNSLTCIQVHGGMGFTWEIDAHLYLKRAHVLASSFSTTEECASSLWQFACEGRAL